MNIVLFEPQIPGNTGNIARTCVGTQTTLHLVGRLGFSLSDRYLKRAGLDYWKDLVLKVHKDWNSFLEYAIPFNLSLKKGAVEGFENRKRMGSEFFFFEKDASKNLWNAHFEENSYLIFGSETNGFPENIRNEYSPQFYKIPMTGPIRSLNLSSAVAVTLYESLRQTMPINHKVEKIILRSAGKNSFYYHGD